MLVVDAQTGLRPGDEELADLLRRWHKPVARRREQDRQRQATCRSRTSSTRSASASRSPSRPRRASAAATCSTRSPRACPTTDEPRTDEDVIRLAVIGRPNVGKSSLVNKIAGQERVIVSDVAGTTRDAIDLPIEVDGRKLIIVDTAGMRRQSKVSESVEYYTALRIAARGRARRRRARRLRRPGRRHGAGPPRSPSWR